MPRCPCQHCGQQIEYPNELTGTTIDCPTCGAKTRLASGAPPAIKVPVFNPARPWAREQRPSKTTELATRITDNIEKVLVGKREQIQLTLVALLSDGHVLLEDVPGVAKTMLARALAQSLDCTFKRIQCTPDLLPNDITGASIFNPKTTEFEFRPGPLFAQVILADEINRATPRAQSALLEAMAERQVSADGKVYILQAPFFLIATQNPIDHEGTFPLPEAQLDRFLMRLSLGYPQLAEELSLLQRVQLSHPIEEVKPVASPMELIEAQVAIRQTKVDVKVMEYLLQIVQATREHDAVRLGASPRASIALLRAAQAYAAIQGYDFVLPDDVKQIVPSVLAHRLILRPESRLRKLTVVEVLQSILNHVTVPSLETDRRP
jgi:MoxR-like ATPase